MGTLTLSPTATKSSTLISILPSISFLLQVLCAAQPFLPIGLSCFTPLYNININRDKKKMEV
jgi:hypothetical protein